MPQSGIAVDALDLADRHGIVFQVIIQFIGAANIQLVSRSALKLLAAPLDVQRIAGGGVGGQEFLGPFPRDDDLAGLGDDDRPTE
jgi:hypothetical protein